MYTHYYQSDTHQYLQYNHSTYPCSILFQPTGAIEFVIFKSIPTMTRTLITAIGICTIVVTPSIVLFTFINICECTKSHQYVILLEYIKPYSKNFDLKSGKLLAIIIHIWVYIFLQCFFQEQKSFDLQNTFLTINQFPARYIITCYKLTSYLSYLSY